MEFQTFNESEQRWCRVDVDRYVVPRASAGDVKHLIMLRKINFL